MSPNISTMQYDFYHHHKLTNDHWYCHHNFFSLSIIIFSSENIKNIEYFQLIILIKKIVLFICLKRLPNKQQCNKWTFVIVLKREKKIVTINLSKFERKWKEMKLICFFCLSFLLLCSRMGIEQVVTNFHLQKHALSCLLATQFNVPFVRIVDFSVAVCEKFYVESNLMFIKKNYKKRYTVISVSFQWNNSAYIVWIQIKNFSLKQKKKNISILQMNIIHLPWSRIYNYKEYRIFFLSKKMKRIEASVVVTTTLIRYKGQGLLIFNNLVYLIITFDLFSHNIESINGQTNSVYIVNSWFSLYILSIPNIP